MVAKSQQDHRLDETSILRRGIWTSPPIAYTLSDAMVVLVDLFVVLSDRHVLLGEAPVIQSDPLAVLKFSQKRKCDLRIPGDQMEMRESCR